MDEQRLFKIKIKQAAIVFTTRSKNLIILRSVSQKAFSLSHSQVWRLPILHLFPKSCYQCISSRFNK